VIGITAERERLSCDRNKRQCAKWAAKTTAVALCVVTDKNLVISLIFWKIKNKFFIYHSVKLTISIFSGVPRNFVRGGGGFQQIQLRTEDTENGDLGTVAPLVSGS